MGGFNGRRWFNTSESLEKKEYIKNTQVSVKDNKIHPLLKKLRAKYEQIFGEDIKIEDQSAIFKKKNLNIFKGGDVAEFSQRQIQSNFFRDSHRSLMV